MLLDYFPLVGVVVPTADGPRTVPVRELLPYAYEVAENNSPHTDPEDPA